MGHDAALVDLVQLWARVRVKRGEVSPRTAKNQCHSLQRFVDSFGHRPVSRMGRSDVERWMERTRTHRPGTRRRNWSTLRQFTRWLVKEGYVARDPMDGLKAPRVPRTVPRVFERHEVVRVLSSCPDNRSRLIVVLMLQLGLRCVEVSRLELGDVGPRSIVVRGKGGHEMAKPILPEVRRVLDAYLAERGTWAGPLVENQVRRGEGITPHTVSRLVYRLVSEAGVKAGPGDGRSAHTFRRTCATDMLERGADIIDVAEALGHHDLSSIRHYAAVRAARLEAAMGGRTYLGEVG